MGKTVAAESFTKRNGVINPVIEVITHVAKNIKLIIPAERAADLPFLSSDGWLAWRPS